MKDVVIYTKLRGFTHVIMETDYPVAVNLWNTRYTNHSIVAPILAEIGELALSFTSFVI